MSTHSSTCWITASDPDTAKRLYRRYVGASDSQALAMLEEQTVMRTEQEAIDKVTSLPGLKNWQAYEVGANYIKEVS